PCDLHSFPTRRSSDLGHIPITEDDLLRNQTLTEPMLDLLRGAVKSRLNVVISGGTGAGKTTLLNVLSGYISEKERIVTIEDSAELQLKQRHCVRLETRPANIEGSGSIMQRQLVINSLRMRPDRIVVGEVRGEEDDVVSLQDVFVFDKQGISPDGRVMGAFTATGVRPNFSERLNASGINVLASWFEHSHSIN